MNLIRSTVLALSVATLVFSAGSSSTATTHSHPKFTVADDRTLSLRESGSRLVVDTIENALRQGGIALFDERFQIDSSLDWVLGEDVSGELDAVIPLWSKGRHNVFTQPGFVLWKGLADDDRLDGNLGVVYRTETIKGIIGGASLFYDHDFQVGHSRLGIGVDAQKDGFYGAFNYYHPLSDTQDAREGYVEDALQGMNASVAVESDVTRVGGNVGYWLFQGDEDAEDEWEFSYGFDAGLRLMPGVFLEGRLERHDKEASFGRRASVGLAFRFTLPNLDGKSYGDGGSVSNLYRPVDREKRILYEEREAGPTVSVGLPDGVSANVEEGKAVNVEIRLDDGALEEDVTVNLVGSGSATYNDDWTISVGGTDCPMVTEDNCSITIMAGQMSASAVVSISNDGRGETAETIILSTTIADAGNTGLTPSSPLVLTIPDDPPLATVSLVADATSITEGDTATLTLTLSETLGNDVTFNLISSSMEATYGTSASDDWNLSVGGTDCDMASQSNPCQVMIQAGNTSAEATVEINADSTEETTPEAFTVSVEVDSGSISLVTLGSSSSSMFIVSADTLETVTLRSSFQSATEGFMLTMTVGLINSLSEAVTLNLVEDQSSTATYGTSGDWYLSVGGTNCNSATGTDCQVIIPAGMTSVDVIMHLIADSNTETSEQAIVSIMVASGRSEGLIQTTDPSRVTINIVD